MPLRAWEPTVVTTTTQEYLASVSR